jgi:hypothetical protein
MTEDFAVVAIRSNRNVWHEPADGATTDDPAPKCARDPEIAQVFASEPTWDSRRREIATAWYDKCVCCAGDYEPAGGQASLPTSTEVSADD